ncbi:MAG: M24 family metallopeptidase [Woeseiaceae bacterium]
MTDPISDDLHSKVCRWRLQRVREKLAASDCDAILLFDPVNIRYATDTTNMQVWTLHNRFRYAVIVNGGPVILWEFHNCEHLHDGNRQVDEIRPAISCSYFGAGSRAGEKATEWARDLIAVVAQRCGTRPRIAVDMADPDGLRALQEQGVSVREGESIMEQARLVKSSEELEIMRWTMRVCETGIERMRSELRAGMTEQELWAWLHYENIRHGGEWIETRLLVSGPRTNPWMQEASDRSMQQGELVCFDADLIGPYGYCADVSRTWTVGDVEPTSAQRDLYRYAFEQIQINAEILKPGLRFREYSQRAWPIPERFYQNRYSFIAHGVGMGDEYPGVPHWGKDWENSGYDGIFEENMVVSVESYIGEVGGTEGVKLEQQYLITADGVEDFCRTPWNDDWL